MSDQLTVIVPTVATAERHQTLLRAIASIQAQDTPCRICVVVNGRARSKQVEASIAAHQDVELVDRAEPGLAGALAAGVAAIDTPYFCFLDDDDTLYPDACGRRLKTLRALPDTDVLVTAGEKCHADGSVSRCPDLGLINPDDLARSLFDVNWLASCGGVFRRVAVGPEDFAMMPKYLEWTYLAFQLARRARVRLAPFDDGPHFTVYETAGSESTRPEYTLSMPASLERLRSPSLPAHLRGPLARKISAAYHAAADEALRLDRRWEAWRCHLKSMRQPSGLYYLTFTRHLLTPRKGHGGGFD